MTMEPIQSTAASYQGSGTAVEKAQSTQKAEVQAAERVAAKPQQAETKPAADAENPTERGVKPEAASDSAIKKAVEDINRQSPNTEAVFGYHEGTNRVTIKIIDRETKEVKKEYPAEETLDMIQKVWEMAGLMVDEKR